jgi:hypothetical protein
VTYAKIADFTKLLLCLKALLNNKLVFTNKNIGLKRLYLVLIEVPFFLSVSNIFH